MTSALAGTAVLALAVWVVIAFNRLVRHRNLVREAWSGIDVQLKRRHDLVASLVEVVRAVAAFEQRVLEDVTRLRSEGRASRALQDGENALSAEVRGLLALVEGYPELRASQSFLRLQEELVTTESQLQMARRYYNGTVRDYNTAAETFPANVVANAFGFHRQEFFQIDSAVEGRAPEVKL